MEALKNWLLGAALVAVLFLAFEVRQQARAIERMAQEAREAKASDTTPSESAPAAPVQTSAPSPPLPAAVPDAGELLAITEELGRYKAGLEKCVVALNATVAAGQRTEVRSFVLPSAAPAPRAAADIVELAEPYVLPSGNSVVVSGKLYNRGAALGEVTVAVTLLENGRRADEGRQQVSVGAGRVAGWQQVFRWDGHEAMWAAQVEIGD